MLQSNTFIDTAYLHLHHIRLHVFAAVVDKTKTGDIFFAILDFFLILHCEKTLDVLWSERQPEGRWEAVEEKELCRKGGSWALL